MHSQAFAAVEESRTPLKTSQRSPVVRELLPVELILKQPLKVARKPESHCWFGPPLRRNRSWVRRLLEREEEEEQARAG